MNAFNASIDYSFPTLHGYDKPAFGLMGVLCVDRG